MIVSHIKFNGDFEETIKKAVEEIGGFRNFIKAGERILLKPNFNTADPYPASTSYEFLEAVVKLLYEQGASKVVVGDSSTMMARTRNVMVKLGIFNLTKLKTPAQVIVFEEAGWLKLIIPGGKFLKSVCVPKILNKVDKVILLPCLKTHVIAKFTGALKLSVGFMKPIERLALHIGQVQEKIAELNKIIPAHLVIMDARQCFITEGPAKGELREPNLILASNSRVAIDIAGVNIIKSYNNNSLVDIKAEELAQIKLATEFGIK